jgi:hypothetical protein
MTVAVTDPGLNGQLFSAPAPVPPAIGTSTGEIRCEAWISSIGVRPLVVDIVKGSSYAHLAIPLSSGSGSANQRFARAPGSRFLQEEEGLPAHHAV